MRVAFPVYLLLFGAFGELLSSVNGISNKSLQGLQTSEPATLDYGKKVRGISRQLANLDGACSSDSDCTGANQVCSSSKICLCAQGYYASSASVCSIVTAGNYPAISIALASATSAWWDVAASADFTKIYATVEAVGYIQVSADGGESWADLIAAGSRDWRGLACSDDGRSILGTVNSGSIFESTDIGVTWNELTAAGISRSWCRISGNADLIKMIGSVYGGLLWISTDGGSSWASTGTTKNWLGTASSSDFAKLGAIANGDYLYLSSDSGSSWTAVTSIGTNNWEGLTASDDFTKVAASANGDYVYLSTDSGSTWASITSLGQMSWRGLYSDRTFTKFLLIENGVGIWHSIYDGDIDTSTTWSKSGSVIQLAFVGAVSEATCGSGTYSAAGTSTCISTCPAGTYVSSGTVCADCVIGKYSNAVGATDISTCNSCSTGYSTVATGTSGDSIQTACACDAGYGREDTSVVCGACESSTWKSAVGDVSCTECVAGKYATTSSSAATLIAACLDCGTGYTTSATAAVGDTAQVACICAAGYGRADNTAACVACIAGKYKVAAGDTACTDCTAGTYATDVGATIDVCVNCGEGKYSDTVGAGLESSCNSCGTGYSTATTGVESSGPAQTTCICATGYGRADNTAVCVACIAGKYKDTTGDTACIDCLIGKYQTTGTTGAAVESSCNSCGTGYSTATSGIIGLSASAACSCAAMYGRSGGICTQCIAGKYAAALNDVACVDCETGKWSGSAGVTGCIDCLVGTYMATATTASTTIADCDSCGLGYNTAAVATTGSAAQTACLCSTGYGRTDNTAACVQCIAGKYKDTVGDSLCIDCISGKYANDVGATTDVCTSCAVGKFSETTGATTDSVCLSCGTGYAASAGATGYSEQTACVCATGYGRASNSDPCVICDRGKYQGSEADTECIDCAAGMYQSRTGQSSCSGCSKGKTSYQTGATGVATCDNCPSGYTTLTVGTGHVYYASDPTRGPKESCVCLAAYGRADNSTDCAICTTGKYKTNDGDALCTDCSAGKYGTAVGADSNICINCAAGYYSGNAGSTVCTICGGNNVMSLEGASSCEAPTGQPTGQPSMMPSGQPTSQPTSPTGQPTGRPSGQPSTQPSSAPTGQPTMSPTHSPTTSSPLPDGVARTRYPTKYPTSRPTSTPTVVPTSMPSFGTDGVILDWLNTLSQNFTIQPEQASVLTNQAVFEYALKSNNYASDDTILKGTCDDWTNFWRGGPASQYEFTATPSKLRMVKSYKTTESFFSFSNASEVVCNDRTAITNIIGQLTRSAILSDTAITCNSHSWVVKNCTNVPTVCIDCSAETLNLICDSTQSACESQDSYIIAPCATSICARRHGQSLVKILTADFDELSPPPEILSSTTSATSDSITINLSLSAPGNAYCTGIPMTDSSIPDKSELKLLDNHAQTDAGNIASVTIPNLEAVTYHRLWCMTISAQGVEMDNSVLFEQSKEKITDTVTICCKTTQIKIIAPSFDENTQQKKNIVFKMKALPATDIAVHFDLLEYLSGGGYITHTDKIFPSSLYFQPKTKKSKQERNLGMKALSSGYYSISVRYTGTNAADYSPTIAHRNITVLASNNEPPAPQVLTTKFSDRSRSIHVTFDQKTDQGGLANKFPCDNLMTFAGSEYATCDWRGPSKVVAYPSSDSTLPIPNKGSPIIIKPGILKAKCPKNTVCTGWSTVSLTNTTVAQPDNPILPVININGAEAIGFCDDFTLELTGSTGNCGRKWKKVTFIVTSNTPSPSTDAVDIQNWLSNNYKFDPPGAIPRSLMTQGSRYNILVELCNVMDTCALNNHRFVVMKAIKPSSSIIGLPLRKDYHAKPMKFVSSSFLTTCDAGTTNTNTTITKKGLTYTWEVLDKGDVRTDIISTSKIPSILIIPAYSLDINKIYGIRLSVYSEVYDSTSVVKVKTLVKPSKLVPRVAGGLDRTMRANSSISLDASESYDEDIEPSLRWLKKSDLTYTWSCEQLEPVYNESCSFTVVNSTTDEPWKYSFRDFGTGENSISKVFLTVSDYTRSSNKEILIHGQAIDAPLVTLNVTSNLYMNADRKVKITAGVDAMSSGTATWAITSESGFNVTSGALTSYENIIDIGSNTFYFILAPNILSVGELYTFTLTASNSSGIVTSFSRAVIEINAPPVPGLLKITPEVGMSLTTEFFFAAYLWDEEDLPVTYSLYYIDPLSLLSVVIRSRSERTFGYSTLPVGDPDLNYNVTYGLNVYDGLDAVSNLVQIARVNELVKNQTEVQDLVKSQLNSIAGAGAGDIDSIKRAIGTASSVVNIVNCTNAPNCASLNRKGCKKVEDTCGKCLDNYAGKDGQSNSRCVSIALLSANAAAVVGSCTVDSECGVWQDCVSGNCATPNKICPNSCSGNGVCTYVDRNSDEILTECHEDNEDCKAVCSCSDSFYGGACSATEIEMSGRRDVKALLIDGLQTVVDAEDITREVILEWINFLENLTQNEDELSSSSVFKLSKLAKQIVIYGSGLDDILAEDIIRVTVVIDSLMELRNQFESDVNNNSRRRLNIINADESQEILDNSEIALDKMSNLVLKDQEAGEEQLGDLKENFRVLAFSADIAAGSSVTLTSPSTSIQTYSSVTTTKQPTTRINACTCTSTTTTTTQKKKKTQVASIVKRNKLYNIPRMRERSNFTISRNTRFNSTTVLNTTCSSSIVKTRLKCGENTDQMVYFSLPNDKIQTYGTVNPNEPDEKFTTKCHKSRPCQKYRTCKSGKRVQVSCDGKTRRTVHSKCPRKQKQPGCLASHHKGSKYTNCSIILANTTASETVCGCSMCSSQDRNTEIIEEDEDFDEMTVIGITEIVEEEVVEDTAAQIDEWCTGYILSVFGLLWILVPLLVLLHRCVLVYWWRKRNKKKDFISRKKTKKGIQADENYEKLRTTVPVVFDQDQTEMSKAIHGMIKRHPYFMAVCEDDSYRRNILILYLVTVFTFVAMCVAIICSFEYPADDGQCNALGTERACLSRNSILDNSMKHCEWDSEFLECNYLQNDVVVGHILLMILLLALFFVPIVFLIDIVFFRVLLAPPPQVETKEDLEKEQDKELDKDLNEQILEVNKANGNDGNSYVDPGANIPGPPPQSPGSPQSPGGTSRSKNYLAQSAEAVDATVRATKEAADKANEIADELGNELDRLLGEEQEDVNEDVTKQEIADFRHDLFHHRYGLRTRQAVERLDEAWDLTVTSHASENDTSAAPQYVFGRRIEEAIRLSLEEKSLLTEEKALLLKGMTPDERNAELLRIFILDVMGRDSIESKVMEVQMYEDTNYFIVSYAWRRFIIFVICVLLIEMVWEVSLFCGFGVSWELAWVSTTMLLLAVLFFFTFYFSSFICNYILPKLIESKVRYVEKKIVKRIEFQDDDKIAAIDRKNLDDDFYSSTDHFYASTVLVDAYPIEDSDMILSFRSAYPPFTKDDYHGFKGKPDDKQPGRVDKFSRKALLWFASLPLLVQKSTTSFLAIVTLMSLAYVIFILTIYPQFLALGCVGILLIVVCCVECCTGRRKKKGQDTSKVAPTLEDAEEGANGPLIMTKTASTGSADPEKLQKEELEFESEFDRKDEINDYDPENPDPEVRTAGWHGESMPNHLPGQNPANPPPGMLGHMPPGGMMPPGGAAGGGQLPPGMTPYGHSGVPGDPSNPDFNPDGFATAANPGLSPILSGGADMRPPGVDSSTAMTPRTVHNFNNDTADADSDSQLKLKEELERLRLEKGAIAESERLAVLEKQQIMEEQAKVMQAMEQLKVEKDAITEKEKLAEVENNRLLEEDAKLKTETESLRADIERMRLEMMSVTKFQKVQSAKAGESESKLQETSGKLEQDEQKLQEDAKHIEALKAENERLKSENAKSLEVQVERLSKSESSLQATNSKLEKDEQKLQEDAVQIEALKAENERLKADNAKSLEIQATKSGESESKLQETSSKLAEDQRKLQEDAKQIAAGSHKLKAQETQIESYKSEITRLETQLLTSEEISKEKGVQDIALSKEIEQLKADIEREKKAAATASVMKTEILRLEKELHVSETQRTDIMNDHKNSASSTNSMNHSISRNVSGHKPGSLQQLAAMPSFGEHGNDDVSTPSHPANEGLGATAPMSMSAISEDQVQTQAAPMPMRAAQNRDQMPPGSMPPGQSPYMNTRPGMNQNQGNSDMNPDGYNPDNNGLATTAAPLKPNWAEHVDAQGRIVYVNKITKETTYIRSTVEHVTHLYNTTTHNTHIYTNSNVTNNNNVSNNNVNNASNVGQLPPGQSPLVAGGGPSFGEVTPEAYVNSTKHHVINNNNGAMHSQPGQPGHMLQMPAGQLPPGPAPNMDMDMDQSGDFTHDMNPGQTDADGFAVTAPLPPHWVTKADQKGRVFYYNTITKETTYSRSTFESFNKTVQIRSEYDQSQSQGRLFSRSYNMAQVTASTSRLPPLDHNAGGGGGGGGGKKSKSMMSASASSSELDSNRVNSATNNNSHDYKHGPGGIMIMPNPQSSRNSNSTTSKATATAGHEHPSAAGELSFQDALVKTVNTRRSYSPPRKSGGGKHLDQDDEF